MEKQDETRKVQYGRITLEIGKTEDAGEISSPMIYLSDGEFLYRTWGAISKVLSSAPAWFLDILKQSGFEIVAEINTPEEFLMYADAPVRNPPTDFWIVLNKFLGANFKGM